MYTVDYFIDKFEKIPEKDWTIGIQQNGYGQRCAFGHCMPIELKINGNMSCTGFGDDTEEGIALIRVFRPIKSQDWTSVALVNNGEHLLYRQPTPKQRILAALYDIKKMQEVVSADTIINAALKSEPEEKVVNEAQN